MAKHKYSNFKEAIHQMIQAEASTHGEFDFSVASLVFVISEISLVNNL